MPYYEKNTTEIILTYCNFQFRMYAIEKGSMKNFQGGVYSFVRFLSKEFGEEGRRGGELEMSRRGTKKLSWQGV
jgi:hypothetical protein